MQPPPSLSLAYVPFSSTSSPVTHGCGGALLPGRGAFADEVKQIDAGDYTSHHTMTMGEGG